MLAKTENGKKCIYCPQRARRYGTEILGYQNESDKQLVSVPYLLAGTTSKVKVGALVLACGYLESTQHKYSLDIGHVLPIVGEMVVEVPHEEEWKDGAKIAERKVNDYWEMVRRFEKTQTCRKFNNCHGEQLLVASDVNGWVGVMGQEFEKPLRKPQKNVRTRDNLVDYVMEPYQALEGEGVEWVMNRIEAAVAMLMPVEEKWNEVKVISGVSQAYVRIPIEAMLSREFVGKYVDHVIQETGGMGAIKGAAGALLHEYLLEMLQNEGYEVGVDVPGDGQYGTDDEILMMHALGFPPELVGAVFEKMYGLANGKSGKEIVLKPKGC